MVLNELLDRIEDMSGRLTISERREVSALGNGDDLIPLVNDHRGASRLLKKVARLFGECGLTLNANKSVALWMGVVPGKKQLFRQNRAGRLLQILRHALRSGQVRPGFELLKTYLTRVRSGPLKPLQMVHLVRSFVVP